MSESSGGVEILHVDDNQEFADLTATFLEQENKQFNVETATNVAEALTLFEDSTFECIVSDYDMPNQDGIDFLHAVREDAPDLPFILFTGKGSEAVASDAISAGVTDYLQKGTESERYAVLANRIQNAVKRYRAEERVQQQSSRLEAFALAFPDFAAIIDEDGCYVDILSGVENQDLLYAEPEELIGEKLTTVFEPETGERFLTEVEEVIHTNETSTFEYDLQVPAGERRFEARLSPLPERIEGERAVVWVARDVTDRVERTAELRRTKDLLAEMERIADIGAWEYDIGTEELVHTPGLQRLFGIDPETELTIEDASEFYREEDRNHIQELFQACVEAGEAYETDARLVTADGEEKWVNIRGKRTQTSGERLVVRGYVQDISAERERISRLEQAETVFNNAQDMLFIIEHDNEDFVVKRVNPAFERVTGLSNEQLQGRTPQELFGESRGQQIEQRYRQCLAADAPISYEEVVEAENLSSAESPDGDVTYWQTQIAPVSLKNGTKLIVGATRDINEQKQRE